MSILEKLEINIKDWLYHGEWQQPPLSAQFWPHYYQEDTAQKKGLPTLNGGLIMIGGHVLLFKDDLRKLKKLLEDAVKNKDQLFFNNYVESSLQVINNFRGLREDMDKDGGVQLFKKFINESRKIYYVWQLSLYADYFGELLISEAEKFGIAPNEVISYIPAKETLLIKQHREAKKIRTILEKESLLNANRKELEKNEKLWRIIKAHLDEFDWVGTHHLWGQPFSLEKLMREMREMITEEKISQKSPKEISFMTEVAGQLSYIRTYAPEVFNMVAFKARPLMTNLAKELGLKYEEFLLLTPDEIFEYFDKNTKPDKGKLLKRKEGFVVLMYKNREVLIDDKQDVNVFIDKLVPKADINVLELKGQVANKGFTKGIAKVFLVPEDMKKMGKDDILIVPMTTPDFISFMKRASAIVTDIGGVLGHAAIISRELNKPCVIGTKIATQVFKDGDLVEVDADKGIVRKLEK